MGAGDVPTEAGWGEIVNRFAMEKLTKGVRQTKSPRCPLRTTQELADEFGVPIGLLSSRLKTNDGPKPQLQQYTSAGRKSFYRLNEMRTWWASLPPEAKKVKSGQTK